MVRIPLEKKQITTILIFIVVAVWIYIRKDAGTYAIQKYAVELFVVYALYITGEYFVWNGRYKSPSVTCNNFTGSTALRPEIIGEYCVFATGAVYNPELFFAFPGKLATLILPVKCVTKVGRNYVSKVYARRVTPTRVPVEVYRHILKHKDKYNSEEVWFGNWTEDYILNHKDTVPKYDEEVSNLRDEVNKRNLLLEGQNEMILEEVSTAHDIAEKRRGLPFIVKPKKEEE
jgi:hypothetical protein